MIILHILEQMGNNNENCWRKEIRFKPTESRFEAIYFVSTKSTRSIHA